MASGIRPQRDIRVVVMNEQLRPSKAYSSALDDEDLRLIPGAQYEPFERRLLVSLREALLVVGVHNDLLSHGITPEVVLHKLKETLDAKPKASNGEEGSSAVLEYEAETLRSLSSRLFAPRTHPTLLGLLIGLRIRERGGISARGLDSEEALVARVDIVETRLRRAANNIEPCLDLAYEDFHHYYSSWYSAEVETAPLPPPFGLTLDGFRHLWGGVADATWRSELVATDPDLLSDEDFSFIGQLFFRLGIVFGESLRRREDSTYERRALRPRRPRVFYVTNGYDEGQRLPPDREWRDRMRDREGEAHRVQQLEKERSMREARFRWLRHADRLAAFHSQGARDMAWWPLHSNARAGDFVLLRMAEFQPKRPTSEADREQWWQCAGYEKETTCQRADEADRETGLRTCVMHEASIATGSLIDLPGYGGVDPWGWPSSLGGDLVGIGLVTKAPDYLSAEERNATWQGNVGFIRWFPTPLDPRKTVGGEDGECLLPEETSMASLQFDGDRWNFHDHISFPGERWFRLRDALWRQISLGIETELERQRSTDPARLSKSDLNSRESREATRWEDDLKRLTICSENLILGATIESLEVVAPDFYYPLYLEPLQQEARDLTDLSEAWLRELAPTPEAHDVPAAKVSARDRRPEAVEEMPGVVSELVKGLFRRVSLFPDEYETPSVLRDLKPRFGRHEDVLVGRIAERCNLLSQHPKQSNALVLFPAIHGDQPYNALTRPGALEAINDYLRALDGKAKLEEEPDLLLLPLDPAWTERRYVWRFRTGGKRILYLALVPAMRGTLEGSILQSLIEIRHDPRMADRLGSILGMDEGPQVGGLESAHARLGEEERGLVVESIGRFRDLA